MGTRTGTRTFGRKASSSLAALGLGAALAWGAPAALAGGGLLPCRLIFELLTNDIDKTGTNPDDLFLLSASVRPNEDTGGVLLEDVAMEAIAITYEPGAAQAFARGFVGATTVFVQTPTIGIGFSGLPRVLLVTGDPDPGDTQAGGKAPQCDVFEVVRESRLRARLVHRARTSFRNFDNEAEEYVGLPTAVATTDELLNGNLGAEVEAATESIETVFLVFAMNAESATGENTFEVALDLADTFDPASDEPVVALPRSRFPANDTEQSPPAALGIEALDGQFDSPNAFLAAQPNSVGQEQPCEVVLYDDTDGVSIEEALQVVSVSPVARYDGILGNPLQGLRGVGVTGGGVTAGAIVVGPPGQADLLDAIAFGVRSAKNGDLAGLFAVFAAEPPPQIPATAAQQSGSCQPGTEEPLLAGSGFLATNPELVTLLGLPFDALEDLSGTAQLTQLDANRVAVRLSIVDADGEPVALFSAPGLLTGDPFTLQLDLALAGAGSGTITITDAFGSVIDGDVTVQEDGSVLVSFPDLPVLFAGGVADQSCDNASGQLIIEFEGGVQGFKLTSTESLTGLTAEITFSAGGGQVKIAGGCALDAGSGFAGLLGLGPLAVAGALLAALGARRRTPWAAPRARAAA